MPIPNATGYLCLALDFDVSHVPDWQSLSTKDHGLALRTAYETAKNKGVITGVPDVSHARAIVGDADATLAAAHSLPFDNWHEADGKKIHLEFLYTRGRPLLAIRVINTLECSDGVTAVRLALHTLEALEGTPVCSSSVEAFKRNPPFTWTWRHSLNFWSTVLGSLGTILWPAWLQRSVSAQEAAAPVTYNGMRAYYATSTPAPACFITYAPRAPGRNAYKDFITALGKWQEQARWEGFFSLLNFSPDAAPSVVPHAKDLLDIDARYRGIFAPVGKPQGGGLWTLMNALHVRLVFVNNYGRHQHTFKATPTQFLWDWVGMAAPVAGAGCITINGAFLAWTRWTPAGQERGKKIQEEALGKPVGVYSQLSHHKGWLL